MIEVSIEDDKPLFDGLRLKGSWEVLGSLEIVLYSKLMTKSKSGISVLIRSQIINLNQELINYYTLSS